MTFIFNFGLSQEKYIPFVEDDKYWFYYVSSPFAPNGADVNAYTIWMKSDTLLNNIKYKNVYRSYLKGHHDCLLPPCFVADRPYVFLDTTKIGLIREDTQSRKVYLKILYTDTRFPCMNEEHLLYDFNLKNKDTLPPCHKSILDSLWGNLHFEEYQKIGIVDTIYNYETFGKLRKVFITYAIFNWGWDGFPFASYFSIYEGVGMEVFDGFTMSSWTLFHDFCEGSQSACNISNKLKEPVYSEFKIIPNPGHDEIRIDIDNPIIDVEVFDIVGKKYKVENIRNTLDINILNTGLYIVRFKSDNGKIYFGKFLKI